MLINDNSRAYFYTLLFAIVTTVIMTFSMDLNWISALIYTHVILGGLAFAIGGIALSSKKGSPLHKRSGKIFYYAMTVSVFISLLVALMPNHLSPTLFHIAVLSLYFLIGGKRSLFLKKTQQNITTDRLLAITIILVSIAVISYSLIIDGRFHILRTVFGSIGLVFGSLDLWLFSQPAKIKRNWLFLHLSKMIGGYTAAVTAFFVAQNIFSGYYNWFIPTVFAISYIVYWLIKTRTFFRK